MQKVIRILFLVLIGLSVGCYGRYHYKERTKFETLQQKSQTIVQYPVRRNGYYEHVFRRPGHIPDMYSDLIIFTTNNYFIFSTSRRMYVPCALVYMYDYIQIRLSGNDSRYGINGYGGIIAENDTTKIIFYTTTGNDSRQIDVARGAFRISKDGDTIQLINGKANVKYSQNRGNVTYLFHPFDSTTGILK
jgi:hypothetical protein